MCGTSPISGQVYMLEIVHRGEQSVQQIWAVNARMLQHCCRISTCFSQLCYANQDQTFQNAFRTNEFIVASLAKVPDGK